MKLGTFLKMMSANVGLQMMTSIIRNLIIRDLPCGSLLVKKMDSYSTGCTKGSSFDWISSSFTRFLATTGASTMQPEGFFAYKEGATWILEPAKFFTCKIFDKYLLHCLLCTLMHVRDVFFDCLPHTCDSCIQSTINKRYSRVVLKLERYWSNVRLSNASDDQSQKWREDWKKSFYEGLKKKESLN